MEIDVTLPEALGEQVARAAHDIGISPSQLVDEAIAMYLQAAVAAQRGQRLALVDAATGGVTSEIPCPALAQLEWQAHAPPMPLSSEALDGVGQLLEHPPDPTAKLRRAMSRRSP